MILTADWQAAPRNQSLKPLQAFLLYCDWKQNMFYFRDSRETLDIAVYFSGSPREKDWEEVKGQKEDKRGGRLCNTFLYFLSFVNISSIQQMK